MSPIFLQQFMLIKFLVSLLRDEVAIDHWPLATGGGGGGHPPAASSIYQQSNQPAISQSTIQTIPGWCNHIGLPGRQIGVSIIATLLQYLLKLHLSKMLS